MVAVSTHVEERIAYVPERGAPWLGLATEVENLMTASEALEAGGLDWEVESRNLGNIGFPEKNGLYRTDTGAGLGIVGSRFQVLQNKKAFEFADNIVDSGEGKYHAVGSFWGGKRVFIAMALSHLDIVVPGDDSETELFLLLTNGHDGGSAIEGMVTPIRLRCQNMIPSAVRSAVSRFKIRHTGNLDGKLLGARKALGISFQVAEDFSKMAERLALKKVVDDQVLDILRNAVFPIDAEAVSEDVLADHPSTLAFENYLHSETMPDSIRGTAWGALNGIAEFIDYGEGLYRGGKTNPVEQVRANSLLWGTGQAKKQAALKALLKV